MSLAFQLRHTPSGLARRPKYLFTKPFSLGLLSTAKSGAPGLPMYRVAEEVFATPVMMAGALRRSRHETCRLGHADWVMVRMSIAGETAARVSNNTTAAPASFVAGTAASRSRDD